MIDAPETGTPSVLFRASEPSVAGRRAFLVLATGTLALGTAAPAWAHRLGDRKDLAVPTSLFVTGAGLAVIASIVALGLMWKEPRLQYAHQSTPLPRWSQRVLRSSFLGNAARLVSLALFLVVLVATFFGSPIQGANLSPWVVYIWTWVGLAIVHAFFGNLWATLSPWDTIARGLEIGERPRRAYPERWGRWPAALLLLGFVWMEIVYPSGSAPRRIGVAMVVYSVITLTGMVVFGREMWNRKGEFFAVHFELLSRMAPLARLKNGVVVRRPPLAGLPSLEPEPGLVMFIVILIGSTTFDGFARAATWATVEGTLSRPLQMLAGTATLLGMIVAVWLAFEGAVAIAARVAGMARELISVRFVHTLVPIALGYLVAHYFSYLVLEGQKGFHLLSDPFGLGVNYFGTARWFTNVDLVTGNVIWYVQVGAIVTGHIAGVLLGHDRAIADFPATAAVRTQYALLAVMVLFTVGGLLILSR